MSTHSPWLQFVIRLLDSPKTKAKWIVLVEGMWYETSSSPRLPFDLNQSLSFPGLFQLNEVYTSLVCLYFDKPLLFKLFVGRHRRGKPSLLVGYFASRDLFYLYFEAWGWEQLIYVDP